MQNYPIPAVGVIVEKDDTILLIKKGRGIFQGQWCIPGGKIEIGEEIANTIRREIREETSLEITDEEFITYQETIEKDSQGSVLRHFVFFNFRVKYLSGELCAADDAAEAQFFKKQELVNLDLSAPTVKTFKIMGLL